MKVKLSHTDQVRQVHIPYETIVEGKLVKVPMSFDGKVHEMDAGTLQHICQGVVKRGLPGDGFNNEMPGNNLSKVCIIEVETVNGISKIDIEEVAVNGYIAPEPAEPEKQVEEVKVSAKKTAAKAVKKVSRKKAQTEEVSTKAVEAPEVPEDDPEITDDDNADTD